MEHYLFICCVTLCQKSLRGTVEKESLVSLYILSSIRLEVILYHWQYKITGKAINTNKLFFGASKGLQPIKLKTYLVLLLYHTY